MAEIPWWAWLGVGLFVAVGSAFGEHLTVFSWIGLVFIAIGIAKIVFMFVLKTRETPKERQMVVRPQPPIMPQGLFCSRCRVTVQSTDYFCRICGTRLR